MTMAQFRQAALLLAAAAMTYSSPARVQDAEATEVSPFNFRPVVIDGSNSTGATVGLQWDLRRDKNFSFEDDDEGEDIPPNIALGAGSIGYKLSGTATADRERNPKNFLDALVDVKLRHVQAGGRLAGGLFAAYEADQSFENRQFAYGLRATAWKRDLPFRRDVLALDLNLGQVDPSKDTARQAALGSSELERYERWNLEFAYKTAIRWKDVRSLELNYRYYREISPPDAVRAEHLHEHKLGTARLALKNDLFIAYSRGKLPFDRESDKIFEIGWTHNLK
jgi:hypothetical protein